MLLWVWFCVEAGFVSVDQGYGPCGKPHESHASWLEETLSNSVVSLWVHRERMSGIVFICFPFLAFLSRWLSELKSGLQPSSISSGDLLFYEKDRTMSWTRAERWPHSLSSRFIYFTHLTSTPSFKCFFFIYFLGKWTLPDILLCYVFSLLPMFPLLPLVSLILLPFFILFFLFPFLSSFLKNIP
jgi:hypothetical protein